MYIIKIECGTPKAMATAKKIHKKIMETKKIIANNVLTPKGQEIINNLIEDHKSMIMGR